MCDVYLVGRMTPQKSLKLYTNTKCYIYLFIAKEKPELYFLLTENTSKARLRLEQCQDVSPAGSSLPLYFPSLGMKAWKSTEVGAPVPFAAVQVTRHLCGSRLCSPQSCLLLLALVLCATQSLKCQ